MITRAYDLGIIEMNIKNTHTYVVVVVSYLMRVERLPMDEAMVLTSTCRMRLVSSDFPPQHTDR